ncbi:MAG: Ribosome-recycling factor [Firmicutes bacterium]|nr:Ribosome-recycling factor [candidate division NPL-UPA2 bacterium]MBT9153731.1 Ribosome-recycling factor [candidate division NPL-UPA2 bacterium]MBT9155074.1 Ribosome-recycling factor [candidate division NPL-UPA2 bacterium]MBT9175970.1 Ribosome-recycling factor [Bacillota bacterium]
MIKDVLREIEDKMKKSVQSLQKELGGLRAGRATPALLEKLVVEYYGVPSPVHQIASVTVPDARTLVIQPWDKALLKPIEKAIQKSDLGLTPNSDGALIRLSIPALTTERRNELVKVAKKKAEEARVAIRNLRRDANELVKKLEKDGSASEDQTKKGQEEVQKLTDKYIKEADEVLLAKEAEIMEV